MFSELSVPGFDDADLKVYFSEKVHSGIDEFRQKIRQEIIRLLNEKNIKSTVELLDLSAPPTDPSVGLSVSHSKEGSLFIIDWKNRDVGVDIEALSRVSDRLIERISVPDEVKMCPQKEFLFSAKEACWKAVNIKMGIPTISNIQTHKWKDLGEGLYKFSAKINDVPISGAGYVFIRQSSVVALFLGS